MNSQTWADWIQVVTGIAVLIGLGLVVWELRQNRDATLSQLSSEYFHIAAQERTAIFGEESASVLARACHRPAELTESDLVILEQVYDGRIMRIMRTMILRRRGGFYGEETWKEVLPDLELLFSSQTGRAYWSAVASTFVDSELYEAGNEFLRNWNEPMCDERFARWEQEIRDLASK